MESVEPGFGPFLVIHDQTREEDADEYCNNIPTIQKEKIPAREDTKEHSDSHHGCRVSTVWRRWISFWLRRKYTSKTFTGRESIGKPASGVWRWLSRRHLLLLLGSRHPHLAAGDQLHICPSTVESLQPCVMSSSVMNTCFLDDGDLVASPHEVIGNACSDARLRLYEHLTSSGNKRVRATGFSDMFHHFCTETRIHFWEESDSDTEELLTEEDEGEGV